MIVFSKLVYIQWNTPSLQDDSFYHIYTEQYSKGEARESKSVSLILSRIVVTINDFFYPNIFLFILR